MAKSTLKLVGAYEAWAKDVRQGRLVRATGVEVSVLVRVYEDLEATPELLGRLREDARLLGRLQHESVLRIEHISAVGGKVGEIYEGFEAASAARILKVLRLRNQVLPARAAVEAAAAVGLALDEALRIVDGDRAVMHPGPGPDQVLIDTAGRVKLAGFRVSRAGDPPAQPMKGYAAPEGGGGAAAATYLVGALLVELLSGEPPPEASADPERHEAAIRRALIRVLARPGDTPGDPVVQVVRQALAHDPTIRGAPGALGKKLRELAVALSSPGLRAWAPGSIPSIQRFSQEASGVRASALPLPAEETVRAPLGASNRTIAPPDPERQAPDKAPRSPAPSTGAPRPLPDAPSRSFERGATIVPDDLDDQELPDATPIGLSLPQPPQQAGALGRVVAKAPELRTAPPEPTRPARPEVPRGAGAEPTRPTRPEPAPPRPSLAEPTRPSRPEPGFGPSVGPALSPDASKPAGPAIAPSPLIPARRPTAMPMSGPLLERIGEADESEATVVGIERAAGPIAPDDPFGPDPAPASGPALVSRSPASVLDDDEAAPGRGTGILVTALFALAGLLVLGGLVLGIGWFVLRPSVEEEVVTPTEVTTPVPAEPTPAPAPEAAPLPEAAPTPTPEPTPPAPTPPAPAATPASPVAAPATTPVAQPPSTTRPTTRTQPAPTAPEPAPEDDGPVRIKPAEAAPTPAPTAAVVTTPTPAAEPEAPAFYRVEFTSGDPSVTTVEVKCAQGSAVGSPTVALDNVPKGNCRVTGRGGDTPLITMVTVVSDRSYTCFASRAPSCK